MTTLIEIKREMLKAAFPDMRILPWRSNHTWARTSFARPVLSPSNESLLLVGGFKDNRHLIEYSRNVDDFLYGLRSQDGSIVVAAERIDQIRRHGPLANNNDTARFWSIVARTISAPNASPALPDGVIARIGAMEAMYKRLTAPETFGKR